MITFTKQKLPKHSIADYKKKIDKNTLTLIMFNVAKKFGYSEAKKMSIDELWKCFAFMQLEVDYANRKQ